MFYKGMIWEGFGKDLGRIREGFGKDLGRIREGFGKGIRKYLLNTEYLGCSSVQCMQGSPAQRVVCHLTPGGLGMVSELDPRW